MKPIVTLTMNPAIDESTSVTNVVADRKLRCRTPVYEPGGGGINVSRVITKLGGETLAMFLSGGPTGQMFQDLLKSNGVNGHPVPIKDLTRIDLMVIEESTGRQYRFGMPGPQVRAEEWQRVLTELAELDINPEFIVASGSLPPGVPAEFYNLAARISRQLGAKFVLDTSGLALREAIKGGVFLLKPNMSELRDLLGKDIRDEIQLETETVKLVKSSNVEIIVVSLGAAGVFIASRDGTERVRAPMVPISSKVGAGDSMVGGMVLSLARGKSLHDSVRYGVAAGSAAVMTPGSELCRAEDVESLFKSMIAQKV